MTLLGTPTSTADPVNRRILAIAEDQLNGFLPDPFAEIEARTGIGSATVIERIRGMAQAGVIRRVRQTLTTTNLVDGALIAWELPDAGLDGAFEFLVQQDPFTGHVVIREAEPGTAGAEFRLWTTLKVPYGFSLERHAAYLAERLGVRRYQLMRAKAVFQLGAAQVRRQGTTPGARSPAPVPYDFPRPVHLSDDEWALVGILKREFHPPEIRRDLWQARAREAGMTTAEFIQAAERLDARGVIGRFAVVLQQHPATVPATVGALLQWSIPPGREIDAGRELGRHRILTHAYWREGGEDIGGANLFGVLHAPDREQALAHRDAIDRNLQALDLGPIHSGVHWSLRSEVRPSEILPAAYARWWDARPPAREARSR